MNEFAVLYDGVFRMWETLRHFCIGSYGFAVVLIVAPQLHSVAADTNISTKNATTEGKGISYELAFERRVFSNEYYNKIQVSPDDRKIAYAVQDHFEGLPTNDFYSYSGTPHYAWASHIYVWEEGIDDTREVCQSSGNNWMPSWSPDSKNLAFYSDIEGAPQLWVYELDSATCRRVSDAVIKAVASEQAAAIWDLDGHTLYVPLDPDPGRNHAINQSETFIEGAGQKLVAPQVSVFASGSLLQPQESASTKPSRIHTKNMYIDVSNSTIAAIDVRNGSVRILAGAEIDARPFDMRLAPLGKWLSFRSVMYHQDQQNDTSMLHDLWVVKTDGSSMMRIVEGLDSWGFGWPLAYAWHPEKEFLIYIKDNELWRADVGEDGPVTYKRMAHELGPLVPNIHFFTGDGKFVLVGLQGKENQGRRATPEQFVLVSVSGGDVWKLPLDQEKWDLLAVIRQNDGTVWQSDERYLTVNLRDKTSRKNTIARLSIKSGELTILWQGFAKIQFVRGTKTREQLIGIYEDLKKAPDLYKFSKDFSTKARISNIEPGFSTVEIGDIDILETLVPLHDGSLERLRSTMLLPPGAGRGDKLPVIVMIYPGTDYSNFAQEYGGSAMGISIPNLVFTSRGYAIFVMNIKLSPTGPGKVGNPLVRMVDELLPQIYHAAELGYIDINRVAVAGQSYGGYGSAAVVVQTNLFRAAIAVNGPYDLASSYSRSLGDDGKPSWARWLEGGQGRMGTHPWANTKRYIDNSPFYQLDRIRTPLLLIAGEADLTVPAEESMKLFAGLKRLDKPAELAIYMGEPHVIYGRWRTANAVDASKRILGFLEKHIGLGWEPTSEAPLNETRTNE